MIEKHAFCIHGHFYQPPREDPLTGMIPTEPGAAPFRNWNQRINAECYQPNSAAGNFEKISFNIGPTLFSWLQDSDPATYARILEQDRVNFTRYGVGNAMAQSYNHTILPLATRLDKITQIKWGLEDFRYRFGHTPEGMWLPETAVDSSTLSVMVDFGIKYTILAPWQADKANLDTNRPYRVGLPGGRQMVVFFTIRISAPG
jgi:alpha-amylase/alpha-mannosidase (GH57 family)